MAEWSKAPDSRLKPCFHDRELCWDFWSSYEGVGSNPTSDSKLFFSPVGLIKVAWPSGLRRWFKAPVSSEAWVRIPPLPELFSSENIYYLSINKRKLEFPFQLIWLNYFQNEKKNMKGTHGFEPWTYRTAADCSTTELYPRCVNPQQKQVSN